MARSREAIAEAQAKAAAKAEVTVERLVGELAKIGFANMQDYMEPRLLTALPISTSGS